MTVFLGYMSLSANILVLDNDTQVIIEMQVLNHEGLEKRILYNPSLPYTFSYLTAKPCPIK